MIAMEAKPVAVIPPVFGRDETSMAQTAIVVIGRNEGERLRRCLTALDDHRGHTVYVDSGSADESVALSRSLGMEVVELDPTRPFTAARARNEGFCRAMQMHSEAEFVQFVDGDCELASHWLDAAERALHDDANLVAVFGWLHERHPEASIYNRLCEVEWSLAPAGLSESCGGNALIRAAAFRAAGGFDAALPAGEEGELCLRLRRANPRPTRYDDASSCIP